ncbi:hypothetical protein P4S72_22340 [Vibrio sp. PP-XX7]
MTVTHKQTMNHQQAADKQVADKWVANKQAAHESLGYSAEQVMIRADQLAQFSAMEGGLTRAYLTEEHRQANHQLAAWMTEIGLTTWQDEVGNQWGRKVSAHPIAPTLIIGSHSDSVVNAGKYDGPLGILLAIEALTALQDEEFPFMLMLLHLPMKKERAFKPPCLAPVLWRGNGIPHYWSVRMLMAFLSDRQCMISDCFRSLCHKLRGIRKRHWLI